MIGLITGLITAILCFIALRIGYKEGKKAILKASTVEYGKMRKEEAGEIKTKIIELLKDNQVEPWTSVAMLFVRKPNDGSNMVLRYTKGGLDTPDEDGYAVIYPDKLELIYLDWSGKMTIHYMLDGDTIEEQAESAANRISTLTYWWVDKEFSWSDSIKEGLPF